jgi:hypothetical protein
MVVQRDIGELLHHVLKNNLDNRIKSAKRGVPTTFVVFGPQRSGKSTLAIQSAAYCAQQLGKEFTVDHIFFDVDSFLKESVGKKNGVFVIDEAAFDLMGVDWHKAGAKKLLKYLLTGAKYGQIVFFLIPRLEKMTRNVIDDHHSKGLEIFLSRDGSKRSYTLYNNDLMRIKYKLLKDYNLMGAMKVTTVHKDWTFKPDLDFIDVETYDKKKDEAIRKITELEDKEQDSAKITQLSNEILNLRRRIINMRDNLKDKLTGEEIAQAMGYKRGNVFYSWKQSLEEDITG